MILYKVTEFKIGLSNRIQNLTTIFESYMSLFFKLGLSPTPVHFDSEVDRED